jgi:Putative auto-transporter adhesin, head GIN domain
MKKISFLLMCMAATFFATAQIINDPNAKQRDAKNFHGISVSNAFDVYLTQGNEEAVAVSAADTKDSDRITVEVKDGILIIGLEKGTWKWHGNKKLKAYISFIKIDNIKVRGACDVYIQGAIKVKELTLDLSGASDLKGKLDIEKLFVDLRGASDITVSGTVGELVVEASGASNFKGENLSSDFCNVKASGASDIKITVNKELSASASGASDVRYKGDGVIRDIKTSGASSISRI